MKKKGKTALNVTLEEAAVGEVVMYQAEGSIQLPVRIENDTVWLTIDQMVLLFGKSRSTINEHILNASPKPRKRSSKIRWSWNFLGWKGIPPFYACRWREER